MCKCIDIISLEFYLDILQWKYSTSFTFLKISAIQRQIPFQLIELRNKEGRGCLGGPVG